MKKRILAMLLVLCLVASVMPMTVLAAEAKCPGEYAPGFPKDHTLANCDAKLIASVPAKNCQTPSYDLYECEGCGEKFAANFGEVGDHHKVLVDADVPAKECGFGYKCDIEGCGYVFPHLYNCEGKCVCGAKSDKPEDKVHIFDEENPVITKKPVNCIENGEAVYTCVKCGYEKTAVISGAHAWGDLVDEKPNTCTVDGYIAHYQCANCKIYKNEEHKIVESVVIPAEHDLPGEILPLEIPADTRVQKWYVNENYEEVLLLIEITEGLGELRMAQYVGGKSQGSEVYESAKGTLAVFTLSQGDWINFTNASDEKIVGKVHVLWGEPVAIQLSSCYEVGYYVLACQCVLGYDQVTGDPIICDAMRSVELSETAHAWKLKDFEDPTCTSHGWRIYACADCGEIKTEPKKILNCYNTYEEIVAYYNELIAKAKTDKEKADLKAELEALLVKEPTCATAGKYEWACPECGRTFEKTIRALGCDIKTATIEATVHHDGMTFTYCARGTDCDCVCTCSKASLKLNGCTCGHAGDEWIELNGERVLIHKITKVYKKLDIKKPANADKHDWELVSTTASCKQAGHAVYVCFECGISKDVPDAKKEHQAYDKKIHGALQEEPPTCKADGYTYYICQNKHDGVICGETIKVDVIKFENKSIQSLEEVELHKNFDESKLVLIHEGDCYRNGYWKYKCSECKKEVLVKIPGTGEHTAPDDFEMPKPDCTKPVQNWSYNCERCGEKIEGVVKTAHTLPNAAVTGDCLTVGYEAWGVCSVCGTNVEKVEDENSGKHAFPEEPDETYDADCENWGGELYICATCGEREIREYVSDGHKWQINYEKSVDACVESGIQVWECTVDGCDASYSVEVEAKGYHYNIFGNKIDPTVCGACNAASNKINTWFEAGIMANSYNICQGCGKDNRQVIAGGATCVDDGYCIILYSCEHGNYVEYQKAFNHCYWGDPEQSAYESANYGYYTCNECQLCGHQKDLASVDGKVSFGISDDIGDKVVTDGSIVGITISLSGYEADLFGYSFQLGYIGNALEYVGFETLTENFKYNALVQNNIDLVAEAQLDKDGNVIKEAEYNHYVSIIGQSKTDGQNVKLTGTEELITVYFKVIDPNGFCAVRINNWEVVKNGLNQEEKLDVLPVIAVGDVGKLYSFGAELLMDADLNGEVNYKDAAIVWQMASGALEYNYAENLDLNGNGEIDAVDAKLIYQYFVGILTYEEVLNYNA